MCRASEFREEFASVGHDVTTDHAPTTGHWWSDQPAQQPVTFENELFDDLDTQIVSGEFPGGRDVPAADLSGLVDVSVFGFLNPDLERKYLSEFWGSFAGTRMLLLKMCLFFSVLKQCALLLLAWATEIQEYCTAPRVLKMALPLIMFLATSSLPCWSRDSKAQVIRAVAYTHALVVPTVILSDVESYGEMTLRESVVFAIFSCLIAPKLWQHCAGCFALCAIPLANFFFSTQNQPVFEKLEFFVASCACFCFTALGYCYVQVQARQSWYEGSLRAGVLRHKRSIFSLQMSTTSADQTIEFDSW